MVNEMNKMIDKEMKMILRNKNYMTLYIRHIISHISTATHKLRRTLTFMLLMVTLGSGTAWGQVGTDYSGTYYIASGRTGSYNANSSPNTNFYLCPTEDWIYFVATDGDKDSSTEDKNGQPFLTSYQCRNENDSYDERKAQWTFIQDPATGYYYIKHTIDTKKYMVLNKSINTAGATRIRIHLEDVEEEYLDDKALFIITKNASGQFIIAPKNANNYYFTLCQGNLNTLKGSTETQDGQPTKNDGPTEPYNHKTDIHGTLGIYNSATDANAPFYFEDVITRPGISKTSGNNVTITYPTEALIYYTTDGSDPTISSTRQSFTGTSQTVSFTDVAVVKAAAYIGDEYSNIATYVYVHTGSSNPYLLQSVANTSFYMLAGDARNASTTTVNTSSLPQAGMSWHFEDAGFVNGVQCYYVYNTSAAGYLRRDNNYFYIQSTNANNNDYKFYVIPYLNDSGTLAGFYLYNIGKAQYVYKSTNNNVVGNGSNGAVNLTSTSNQDLARWNLILVANKSFPSPVTLSDNSSVTYYTFTSSDQPTYHITTPTGSAVYIKTSTGEIDRQKWYFKDAGSDDWASYYYILNAVTGEAMYFNGTESTGNQDNAILIGELPNTPTDAYKFTLAKTVTDGECYIIPKPLVQFAKTNYTGLWRENANALQSRTNRESNKIKWQISQVVNFIAQPYITYDIATNTATISSTYPGATIYYTTDGTEATTSSTHAVAPVAPNSTASTSFVLTADITAIRAIVYKEGVGTSSESTYSVAFQLTLSDDPADLRSYLIQSQNNAWNTTDFHFYMIPGDVESSVQKVNTTSLFRPSMEWHFLNAEVETGIQYYYIVNNANSNYLAYDGTNVCMLAFDSNNVNKFKFRIVESSTAGTFNFIPYGLTSGNIYINRFGGNGDSRALGLHSSATDANSRWKFVLPTSLDKTGPFTVSDPSTDNYSYYKIASVGSNGYYIVPPSGNSTVATTSNSSDATVVKTMNWYFEEAQSATSNDWLTYYHIRNAATGEYLYFTKDDNNAGACLEMRSTIDPENADRYKFTWAKTAAATANYYIIPKLLKDDSQNQFSTLQRNGGTLQSNLNRGAGNYAWTFTTSSFTCSQPTISWSAGDGGYVVSTTESDARIYYKIGEGTLTPSTGTLYSGAISVADLGVESATIRTIAARNIDGSDQSTETSVTVSRVTTPSFTQTDDGKVELSCTTDGVSYYYEMGNDPSDPNTTSSTPYSAPIEGAVGKVIKAIAVKDGWINSAVATSGTIEFTCATPIIRKTSATTFTIECSFPTSGVTIRYTKGANPSDPTASSGEVYSGIVTFSTSELPFTVKAIAIATDYNNSQVAEKQLTESLDQDVDGYYEISSAGDFAKFIDMVNSDGASYSYKITNDITLLSPEEILESFTGELKGVAKADGSLPVISGLNHAIFRTINGGTVKNIILDDVSISGSGNKGAIANEATGASRIYNCGVLATGSSVETDDEGYTHITTCSSKISGGGYVGGIVGLLDGSSRVINCFSYANITGGNEVGGIVGHNNVETTSVNLQTMVMNCMFYGDITGGTSKAPIYNGEIISNDGDADGVNNYNYFWLGASYVQNQDIDVYNCALAAETRYLQRFEFFRHLLNSNRELAAWWASTPTTTVTKNEIMKWVMEPSQIASTTPYPILMVPAKYYPSVVNIDADNAEDFSSDAATKKTQYNQGRKFGTFTINIQNATNGNKPSGASVTTSQKTPNITDKDPDHFNFNYYKVQLPYYNEVGTGNYTKDAGGTSYVVTGWKIVSLSKTGDHNYTTTSNDASATVDATGGVTLTTPYNFADRKSTQKDLYGTGGSNRVFAQGAYFDIPEGVTSITIEPYWGKCVFVADEYPDVVYKDNNDGTDAMNTASPITTVGGGARGGTININGVNQTVHKTMSAALTALNPSGTVYDNAIVLVGNVHSIGMSSDANDKPYTIMSIDQDNDNEPDYSYILRFNSRQRVHPVRIDFLNVIGLGMAQKTDGGTGTYNFGIMQPRGWFECTNTALFRVTQFEYDLNPRTLSPIILQGGIIEQWVTYQNANSSAANAVQYFHVGGNVWFKEFHMGVHQDRTDNKVTPHPPVSVTGGDFNEFYLTGLYNSPNINYDDNAECYINGGRFGKVAGTGMQGIGDATNHTNGNIIWQIDNADIDEFYGGGINAAHIAEGNIYTVISNSRVDQFCGGPKFGDMNSDKIVVTNATNCIFRTFFGAGYGGNSYNRRYPANQNEVINYTWNTWVSQQYTKKYDANYNGIETRIDYQFLPMSSNISNVARLFVDYVCFSLATTYDVTSKLTGCTITQSTLGRLDLSENDQRLGNFYGGGSLGKVEGPVKSTLINCTIEGNVFGAGYSATKPTVSVMNNAFQTEPSYDENLGVYLDAVPPTTISYTWEHKDVVNSTATAIKTSDTEHILYTQENLSKSNLGSVSGAVSLTIKTDGENGKTIIGTLNNEETGHVYGGGDESYVTNDATPAEASTIVTISGNTEILGNVFGGGNQGDVSGSTTVNIQE